MDQEYEWFWLRVPQNVVQASEGLTGAGSSASKVVPSQASKLVLAVGRRPPFLTASTSPCYAACGPHNMVAGLPQSE